MIPALAFAWLSSTGVALPQPPAAPPKPAPPAKTAPAPKPAPPKKLERPVVTIETPKGVVKVELFPIDAPRNVANILALVDRKFYDGLVFHRIEDWVAQGGDPNGDGTGGHEAARCELVRIGFDHQLRAEVGDRPLQLLAGLAGPGEQRDL
ncbi:MAG: peptidylprolyl isomerase [Armatimonadaceae bacterium]